MATAKGYKCRFAGYKFWILWSPHDLEMWIGQPLKAPEPMCKECLSASYNQNLTLQSFGGNEKRDSARNNGSSGACGPNQRQRLKGNHVERNNEATGLQIWIEKETDPCAIWCHLAAGSTTQRFSCRWNLQGDSSDSSRGLLNLLNRWCWDHSTVDWTLDVTQPDSTTNKQLQKVGGALLCLLILLIKNWLFPGWSAGGLRSSSLAKGGKVGIPSLELDSGPKRWTSANWLCFIVPIVRWFYHLVMTLPVCHGKSPCYSVR